jgi:hypothetical protein
MNQEWNVPQRKELRRIKQRMREVKMQELKQGRCKEAVKNSSACKTGTAQHDPLD